MTTLYSIQIHAGYDVENSLLAQRFRILVIFINKAPQKPFYPPGAHGFTRMLAGNNPEIAFLCGRIANTEIVNALPVKRLTELLMKNKRRAFYLFNEGLTARRRIGGEIGIADPILIPACD